MRWNRKRKARASLSLVKSGARGGRGGRKDKFQDSDATSEGDLFSRLPDEMILHDILCWLPFRDRARLGVVSCRFQKLWVESVRGSSKLFIDAEKVKVTFYNKHRIGREESEKQGFVRWVNHILTLRKRQSQTLDDFTLRFILDNKYFHCIDGWVESVFAEGVKRLELEAIAHSYGDLKYTFANIEKVGNAWSVGIRRLRQVSLKYVSVDKQVVDYMLQSCPFLERLCLWHTGIRDLVICSDTLKSLEYVEFFPGCSEIISVPNLSTLLYEGEGSLRLNDVPLLSSISFGRYYNGIYLTKCCQDLSFISQLKVLELQLTAKMLRESVDFPLEVATLCKLERLEVQLINMHCCITLLWLTVLVQAAPSLHTFTLKGGPGYDSAFDIHLVCWDEVNEKIERIVSATKQAHPNLRVINFLQIHERGCILFPLAKHLFQNVAKSLQEVVLTLFSKRKMPKPEVFSQWHSSFSGEGLPVGVKLTIADCSESVDYDKPRD